MLAIQQQNWCDKKRYLIVHEHGSVQLELFFEKQEDFGGTAYIWGLWVDEGHRRLGIAKELLNMAESISRDLGHDAVYMEWQLANNHRLQRLYP